MRRQDQQHGASITGMITHYVARRAQVTEGHPRATSASVTARHHGNVLTVEISDNGGADRRRGTGLTGLADRVAVTGGRMLLSSPDGGPTLLRAEFPYR